MTSSTIKVLADSTLSQVTTLFSAPFQLSLYNSAEEAKHLLPDHDVLICRSTLNVNASLLAQSKIRCVATASSGVDHIDLTYLEQSHITLIDAKGSNAHAVADYVTSTIAYLIQNQHLRGKKAGVVGVGKVGQLVVERLQQAGFDVVCHDPYQISLTDKLDFKPLADLALCDVICIHANLHHTPPYPSYHLLDATFLNSLKPNTAIINAARGGIVDETALLKMKQQIYYCTDVYENEPRIHSNVIDFSTLCTPHIAGHTIEAKTNAVTQIAKAIHKHYQLPFDLEVKPMNQAPNFLNIDWIPIWLEHYNPIKETQLLKAAENKEAEFLSLRKAHQTRHDFVR